MGVNFKYAKQVGRAASAFAVLASGRGPEARIGVLESRGGGEDVGGITLAELALILTLGTRTIPSRPFLEPGIAAAREQVAAALRRGAQLVAEGKYTLEQAVALGAEAALSGVRRYVRAGVPPPNAPATVERKGSSTPLVDTARLLRALAYEVVARGSR